MPELLYLGPEGTYTHQAAQEMFGRSVTYTAKDTMRDLVFSLHGTSLAFMPIENSTFGPVIETYDVLRESRVGQTAFVRGEHVLAVSHCLVGVKGAKLSDIQTISSHEQAVGQCQEWIKRHLPKARTIRTASTALAAKSLLDPANGPPTFERAAICSRICVSLYPGLKILEDGIQDGDANQTRFIVMSGSLGGSLPKSLPSLKSALIRVVPPPPPARPSLALIFSAITSPRLLITRVDRRPSLSSHQFHDVSFVELASGDPGCNAERWASEVCSQVESIRLSEPSWDITILGCW